MARKPVSIPLPARHSASREVLVPTLPFFLRDPAAEPVDTPPRLFSFESDTFLEDFLAVAAGTRPLPKLLPWRDWSEPPDAMLKTGGAAAYPTATILRREPAALEIDPVPGGAAIPAGMPAWLRKLYLPLHERFNLVAFDLVCRAPGWPRLARGRVKAAGAVIRRLVPDAGRERWEDWIAVDEKQGAWLELLGADLRAAAGSPPVDPAALPAEALRAAEVPLRVLLDLPDGQPLPAVGLDSHQLTLLPPDAGRAAEHCTLYGYLPVFSGARDVLRERLARRPAAEIAESLARRAGERLEALFREADRRAAAAPALRRLLNATVLPPAPTATETTTARDRLGSAHFPGLPAPGWDMLARGIDLALRRTVRLLWNVAADPATATDDLNGGVLNGAELWRVSGARGAATDNHLFDALPDSVPGTGANETALWLHQTATAYTAEWDRLVRERLHQAIEAWLAGNDIPPPPRGQSGEFDAGVLAALCACALLRLRGCRLALAASINRTLYNGDDHRADLVALDPRGKAVFSVDGLAGLIDSVLGLEPERGALRVAPPWPVPGFPELPDLAPLDRLSRDEVLDVHRAGSELAEAYSGFLGELAAAGSAATAELEARAAVAETSLRAALEPNGALPAFAPLGLDLLEPPACGLLVLPGFRFDPPALDGFRAAAVNRYRTATPAAVAAEARNSPPRLRYDPDHLYAVWCWVRVAGHTPCEPERIIWTGRSEPFSIADPTDLLGARPASLRMPDIPKLLRDLPRLARAGAHPFAAVAAPPRSGVTTGAALQDTRRDFGLGMICSFGIPVLTLCALVLFNIIFHILILIPGFAWMLLLKFCIPFPRRGS
jgi:hypothetical protein